MIIQELTNMLFAARIDYKEQYRKLVAEKNERLKEIDTNFKPDTQFYRSRKQEIKEEFERKTADLRVSQMKTIAPYFEELREQEILRAQTINETALSKINAIGNIPLTAVELQALNEKYNSRGDYWCDRALATIAEKNGINPAEIGIAPTLDVKLSIINSLSKQFDTMLLYWDCESKHNAKYDAQLGDYTLQDAVERFTNGFRELDNKKSVDSAFWRIKSAGSEIERSMIISNTMRNMSDENKDMLMYRLVMDNSVPEFTKQMSGLTDVFAEWQGGKCEEYGVALKTIESISNIQDTSIINQRIAEHSDNSFLGKMLENEAKTNRYIRSVLYPGVENSESVQVVE